MEFFFRSKSASLKDLSLKSLHRLCLNYLHLSSLKKNDPQHRQVYRKQLFQGEMLISPSMS